MCMVWYFLAEYPDASNGKMHDCRICRLQLPREKDHVLSLLHCTSYQLSLPDVLRSSLVLSW